jgi:GH24 family phage-related lysozyme (muramidase)
MQGDSRLEMRNIRNLVPKKDYKGIAKELRKMKRIWKGKGLDGLLARRDAEADLVETCA